MVLLSAVFFGIQPIFGHALNQASVDAYALNLIRYSVPAALLVTWLVMTRRGPAINRTHALRHAVLGLGFVGAGVGYYQAGFEIGFGLAVIVFFTFPLMVTLYSWGVLRVRLRPIQLAAMVGALVGLVIAIDIQWQSSAISGVLWALLAGFSYAATLIYKTHYLPPMDEQHSLAALMVGASIIMVAIIGVRGADFPNTGYAWSVAAALSIFAGLIPIGLLMLGTRVVGPLDSATLCTLEPIVAIAVSVSLLGESASLSTLIGGALVISSAAVLMRARISTQTGRATA